MPKRERALSTSDHNSESANKKAKKEKKRKKEKEEEKKREKEERRREKELARNLDMLTGMATRIAKMMTKDKTKEAEKKAKRKAEKRAVEWEWAESQTPDCNDRVKEERQRPHGMSTTYGKAWEAREVIEIFDDEEVNIKEERGMSETGELELAAEQVLSKEPDKAQQSQTPESELTSTSLPRNRVDTDTGDKESDEKKETPGDVSTTKTSSSDNDNSNQIPKPEPATKLLGDEKAPGDMSTIKTSSSDDDNSSQIPKPEPVTKSLGAENDKPKQTQAVESASLERCGRNDSATTLLQQFLAREADETPRYNRTEKAMQQLRRREVDLGMMPTREEQIPATSAKPAKTDPAAPVLSLRDNQYLNSLDPLIPSGKSNDLRKLQAPYRVMLCDQWNEGFGYPYKISLVWDHNRLWGKFHIGSFSGILLVDPGPGLDYMDRQNEFRGETRKYPFSWRAKSSRKPGKIFNSAHAGGEMWFGRELIRGRFNLMSSGDDPTEFVGKMIFSSPRLTLVLPNYIKEWNDRGTCQDPESPRLPPNLNTLDIDPSMIPATWSNEERLRYLDRLTGVFNVECPVVQADLPRGENNLSIRFHVHKEARTLWGKFQLGICEGIFGKVIFSDSIDTSKRVLIKWVAKERGTGLGTRGLGGIFLKGDDQVSGTFLDLCGKDIEFFGTRTDMPVGDSGYDPDYYDTQWKNYRDHARQSYMSLGSLTSFLEEPPHGPSTRHQL